MATKEQAEPMPRWHDHSCFTPEFIEREIKGETYRFHAVSVATLFKLKDAAKPIARALSVLFAGTDNDCAAKQTVLDPHDTNAHARMVSERAALEPMMANERTSQGGRAMDDLIDGIMGEKSLDVFGDLILDSMKDTFPRPTPPAREFVRRLPAPMLAEFLIGVALANKGVFGPLANAAGLEDAGGRLMEAVRAKTGGAAEGSIGPRLMEPEPAL